MVLIKTPEEIKIVAEGGKILAGIMKELEKQIRPGAVPKDLDRLAESLILSSGGKPSFKDYEGFPATLCVSVNNMIVHGLPSVKPLAEGDIVSLDIGVFYRGFHTDMARTFSVGRISSLARKLIKVTRQAFEMALKEVKPGRHFGDIEWATQNYVESQGLNVVRQFCGHGIGRQLHEDPQILNLGKKGTGPELAEGMVFCIEPMVTVGHWRLEESREGFGYETADGSLCCHFEDTIAVTKTGHKVLTKF